MADAPARSRPNNLPAELTSFVGRRKQLSEVKRLLTQTRLLTLTGSGGAGKTRLALRAAAEMARSFPDGVWLVSLASIDDPQLVVQAVFSALGLQDVSGGWSLSTLSAYLVDKRLLLVLDNCEHLLDSCALLAVSLLRSCPELRVLATSRQGLGTTGETRMRVPPLSLPADGASLTPEQVATCEAVALLSERAAAVLPGFSVQANPSAVLRLCRRLDGLPLALELAAVRLEGMTVEQVLNGLERELPVLARGSRGAEARQRTLDATIGWSYGLLEDVERRLSARLSVFAGGFDEEAAQMVCAGPELPPARVAEILASLVEKSIIQRDPDRRPTRYSMLETVRQFDRQRLRELGEEVTMQRKHRDWVLGLALAAGAYGDKEAEAFDRVQLELDNVWSALDFCRRQQGEVAAGIEICRQLQPYWWSRGPLGDVRRILDAFYPLTVENSVPRGWCLFTMAMLAGAQSDAAVAQSMAAESLRIGRENGDEKLARSASAATLFTSVYVHQKNEEELLSLAEAIIAYGRSADEWSAVAVGTGWVCRIRLSQGDLDAAVEPGESALAMCRSHDELFLRGIILSNMAEVRRRRGELDQAEALAREGAAGQHALGSRRGLAMLVETLAWMASDRRADVRAATLLGYAHDLRESIMVALLPVHQDRHLVCEQTARGRLGEAAFARAFDRGVTMPDGEAIAFVLDKALARPPARPATADNRLASILTRRELEIARLIADGLTSHEIAGRLFISERTVTTHVTNMLNKLGLSSRVQLAGWVSEGPRGPAQGHGT